MSYRETNCFSELICDYLEEKPELREFYNRFPAIGNFAEQMAEKSRFPGDARKLLVERLLDQYTRLKDPLVATDKVLNNIRLLESENSFTIVTGHQLNILSGPLYFIYKIISCVRLCEELKSQYPDKSFVPVYWMATEDHDFEEINYIHLYGGRLRWEREAGGPVGRFSTDGLSDVIDELADHLGPGTNNDKLISLFRRAYEGHNNLADATRYLVHELFGEYGLVCVDGDDHGLKRMMIPAFEREMLEEFSYEPVRRLTDKLENLHFKQVHPRRINLFYIRDGLRERIEKRNETWVVLNSEISFTESELKKELQNHPERFSPNVILRPFYQESILPNLAYIGGGGELAYWLQLKEMFALQGEVFPMLVLRNSVLWVKRKLRGKLSKLALPVRDLFEPLHEIQKRFVSDHAPVEPSLSPYELRLKEIFDELEEVAHLTDDSMLGAVNAQRAKQLKGLENLRKKLIRAEKRRKSDEMEQIERVYLDLFPGHGLQERHDNLSVFFSAYGDSFIATLHEKLDPLDFRFTVLLES